MAKAMQGSPFLYDDVTGKIVGVKNPDGSESPIGEDGPHPNTFDVIVYGASGPGVICAVTAARLGKRVLLISESNRLGGITGWGINQTDFAISYTPGIVVGAARDYYARIGERETTNQRAFSRFHRLSGGGRPSWFIRAFNELVAAEPNLRVVYNTTLVSASKLGTRLTGITTTTGTYTARAFHDMSYTGDLIAAAGCSVSIGRESTALYGEASAGVLAAGTWAGGVTLDPYVTAGVPSSGLIPGIESTPLGTIGSGDGRVMGFGFRLFITNAAGDKIAFPTPDMARYSAANYELLARAMAAAPTSYDTVAELFQVYTVNSSSYSDLNNRGTIPCSLNYHSELCKEYVTASAARRQEIREAAMQWVLGLFYWIANSSDVRIPAALKVDLATYGLSNEELLAYGGFSPELYVREGRRLVGDLVMTAADMTLNNGYVDQIAFGYYDVDSHRVRILVSGGKAVPEGSQLTTLTTSQVGFPIPYRALLPKASECTNLWSATCPSVSRYVFCSIRIEPIMMAMAQAAGIASSEAIDGNIDAASVPYRRIAKIQDIHRIWDGIVCSTDGIYGQGTPTVGGVWATVNSASANFRAGCIGGQTTGFTTSTFRTAAAGANTIRCQPQIWDDGVYKVLIKYPPDAGAARADNLVVRVSSNGTVTTLALNQRYPGGRGGDWEDLGNYFCRSGACGMVSAGDVGIDAAGATGTVALSAFKFVPV